MHLSKVTQNSLSKRKMQIGTTLTLLITRATNEDTYYNQTSEFQTLSRTNSRVHAFQHNSIAFKPS